MISNKMDEPLKIKPENNRWYLLATLYGEPAVDDPDLRTRNRTAWNRFMAAELAENDRLQLSNSGRHTADELTPLSTEEMVDFRKAFFDPHGQATSTATAAIPDLKNDPIDFSSVVFDGPFLVLGYCL
jgi:hypothetical protein